MNDIQNAKLNMYQVVLNTYGNNRVIYESVPALVKVVDKLSGLVADIRKVEQQQAGTLVKGASNDKADAKNEMVRLNVLVANSVYVYAFETSNNTLLQKMSVNKNLLYKLHDNDLLAKSKDIAETAAQTAGLEEYGITAAHLSALSKAIADYEALIVLPRLVVSDHKQYTTNLAQLFAAANSVLYDQSDKLIGLFKESNPDFVATYKTARNLINTAARKAKTEEKQ
jgi:uncharacterized protein (UPF0297 family)